MQSWRKTWPLNGSSRIRVKQKLHRKHRGACKSSWSQIGSLKSFTLTIPWNLAKLVKIFPGIIVRRHHTDQKRMGLLTEQCVELWKGHLRCCCNQVWTKNGGECFSHLRHIQALLSDGKTPHERWFGMPSNGTVIPFGRTSSYFCERHVELHQFGPKVLPGIFLGYVLSSGGI